MPFSLPVSSRYFFSILACLLLLFSINASAQQPSITSATIKVTAPLENGAKVSYGGSDVWIDFSVETAGNETTIFQLWEQYNNGTWVLIRRFDVGWQISDWFLKRPKPVTIGTYRYRLLVSRDGYEWSTPFETDMVTIRAPRTAPTAAFSYFQINDIYGYRAQGYLEEQPDKYLFHKDNGVIKFTWSHIANDIASRTDLYYEFLSRKAGDTNWKVDTVNSNMDSFQWNPYQSGLIGLNNLETYEFAIRACNPYGCTPNQLFSKPVQLDFPDVVEIPPPSQYFPITGADLWFEVYDDVTKHTNIQNYCLADPLTQKCKASTGRIVGRVDGVVSPGALSLYNGTVLTQHATGTGTIYVVDAVKDLPIGVHTFVLKSGAGAEGVFIRKRFYVYLPNEGSINAFPCTINAMDTSCTTSITWNVNGTYPSCLFQINGSVRTELACILGGSNQTQNIMATIGVTASQFEIVAKEPTAERVTAQLNLGANFKDVVLSATPDRCDIIRPATSCLTRVSWKASAEYTPCLYQNNLKLICSNESQLEISVSAPNTQFKILNGPNLTDKLLGAYTVKAVKPPTGSLTVVSGSQNPCIPNNTNTCTVNVTYSHIGGYMGVSLYKDGQEWAFLGTSGETPPNTYTKALTVNAGGTTYSMKATVEGQLYDIATLTLYTTTYASQGYSLTATPNECTYNPITETGCKPTLTWAFPAADACIFQDNRVIFCPDSTFLNGSSPNTLPLAAGNRLYQIRKGNTPTGALVAQVGVLSKEQTIADIKAQSAGCYNAGCKIELRIFSNYPGNVCLYDNGVKVTSYCNLNRQNYISDYVAAPGIHTLELKLEANGQTSVVAETTLELQYTPAIPGNLTAVLHGNTINVDWSASIGATSYLLERNGQPIPTNPLLFNSYSDSTLVPGTAYTYRVKACVFSMCSGWATAAPVVLPIPAASLPITIQAEDYASMFGVLTQTTTDVGGGQNIYNLGTGDWMSYSNKPINIPLTGTYKVTYRVATYSGNSVLVLKENNSGNTVLDTVTLPNTVGWQTWVDVIRQVNLTQGVHSFTLSATSGNINVNWFKIEAPSSSSSSSQSSISTSASSSSPSNTSTSMSSASQSSIPPFDFNTQAPSDFKYDLSSLNIPNLANLTPVAITQGSTSVNNGALGYKIAIEPPPGINNHVPSLAITYNSRGGNGIAGVGWSLSGLSAISRCPPTVATDDTGVSDPYTNKDDLCLDGQRLVVKGRTDNVTISRTSYWASGTTYVTEQANFTEITSQGYGVFPGEPNSFIAKTKDGKTLYFGEANRNAKVFAADDASKGTKSWHLTRVSDRYGNEYSVYYNYDTVSGEHLPGHIVYAPGAAIVFNYAQRLGQTPWGSKDGKKFRQPSLLKSVDTYINVTNSQYPTSGTPVRRYELEYKLSPSTDRDLVSKIQECGWNSFQWNCAKPLVFNYEPGSFTGQEVPSPITTSGGPLYDYSEFVDIDGDGYNDALLGNGIAWGQADGRFLVSDWTKPFDDYSSIWDLQIVPIRTDEGMAIVVRRIDSVILDPAKPWDYSPSRQSINIIHSINRTNQTKVVTKLNFSTGVDDSYKIGAFIIGDFDCDGLDDMYYRGKVYTQAENGKPWTWLLDNSGTYAQNASAYMANTAGPCSVKKPVLTTNNRSKVDGTYTVINPLLVDLNGDGNKELISHQPTTLKKVYRVGGDGFTLEGEQALLGSPATNLPDGSCFSATYDLDEDGREDILGVSPTSGFSAFLARDNDGLQAFFSAPISLSYLANYSSIVDFCSTDSSHIRPENILVGDINGDGRPDIKHAGGFISYPKKSDMLVQVTNGFGAETVLTYSTLSNDVYSPASVKPKFPYAPASRAMWVVKSVATTNGKGGYNTQNYRYKGATTHLEGRGFIGFEQITVTDDAKELVNITDYNQQWPSTVSQQVLKDTSGRLISVQNTLYDTLTGNGTFVYPKTQIKKSYGLLSSSIDSPVSTQVTESRIDSCGNPEWQTQRVGGNYSNGVLSDELSRIDTAYVVDPGQTNTCTDDFISQTYVSYNASGETRLVTTAFEKNTQGDIVRRTDFQGTALEKVTIIDRTAQGVTKSITESAKDVDSTTTEARLTSFADLEANAWPRTATNALNQSTQLTYDPRFGTVATEINRFANTATHYDELGRVTSIKTKDNTLTENISFYCANNAALSCPSGAVYGVATRITNSGAAGYLGAPLSIVFYDVLQRQIQSSTYGFDGNVVNKTIEYTASGRVARVSEPYLTNGIQPYTTGSAWTSYSGYDALGRAATVMPAAGGSTTTSYSRNSFGVRTLASTLVVSSNGSQTQTRETHTNALGQVTRAVDAIGGWVDYTYDAQGNLKTTKVNNNNLTKVTLTHDIAGNKTFISDPDAKDNQFEYNGFGELRRQTWQPFLSQKKTLTFSYDRLGRKTQRVDSGPNLSGTYTWTYDQNNQPGMLTGRSGGGLVDTYQYDSYGRLESSNHNTDGKTYSLGYQYDAFGRLTQSTSPEGFKALRDYSAQGYQVRTRGNMAQNTQVLWALGKQQDNIRGEFTHQLMGNGVVTRQTFDAIGNITHIRSGRLSSTSSVTNLSGDIQNLGYQYDSVGNLRYRESKRTDMNGTPLESLTETLTYDALNRLDVSTGTGTYRRNYGYDALGNLTFREDKENSSSANRDLGALAYENVRNAGPHAVTAAGGKLYSYDLYGNMTQRGTETLTYDIFNKPTRIAGASTSDFYYDADHQLYKQVVDGVTTVYLGNVEIVREGLTTTVNTYVDGVQHRNVNNGANAGGYEYFYLHRDHLGSVEAISNRLGNFHSRMSFDAWGNRQQDNWTRGNPTVNYSYTKQGYTGHEQLDAHKLVHMQGRVYDPALGRFLSADPMVQSPYNTQSYNRYSYVFNNPLSFTDPSGYESTRCGSQAGCSGDGKDHSDEIDEMVVTGIYGCSDGGMCLMGGEAWNYAQQLQNWTDRQQNQMPINMPFGGAPGSLNVLNPMSQACGGDNNCMQQAGNELAKAQGEILLAVAPIPGLGKVKALEKVDDIAKALGLGKTSVYMAVDGKGKVVYVGISDNLVRRAAEHLRDKGISIEGVKGLTNLVRSDARAVEQVLIEKFGLSKDGGTLMNKINSIAETNPYYQQAIERGTELLNKLGY